MMIKSNKTTIKTKYHQIMSMHSMHTRVTQKSSIICIYNPQMGKIRRNAKNNQKLRETSSIIR